MRKKAFIIVRIVIGNIFGLLCGLFCISSTFAKTKKNIMGLQCLDYTSGLISCLILGEFSGVLTQFISLVRNFLVYKGKMKEWMQYILVVLLIVIGIAVNRRMPRPLSVSEGLGMNSPLII